LIQRALPARGGGEARTRCACYRPAERPRPRVSAFRRGLPRLEGPWPERVPAERSRGARFQATPLASARPAGLIPLHFRQALMKSAWVDQETLYPLEFFIEGVPVSLGGSTRSKDRWKTMVAETARQRQRETEELGFLDDRAVAVTIYYFPIAPMEGDIDNIVKPILDALIGIAYPDDAFYQKGHCGVRRTCGRGGFACRSIGSSKSACPGTSRLSLLQGDRNGYRRSVDLSARPAQPRLRYLERNYADFFENRAKQSFREHPAECSDKFPDEKTDRILKVHYFYVTP
jgi:hypothetical protein